VGNAATDDGEGIWHEARSLPQHLDAGKSHNV
jgi:hypothetical protein